MSSEAPGVLYRGDAERREPESRPNVDDHDAAWDGHWVEPHHVWVELDREWPRPVLVLDSLYWRDGARVSVGGWTQCPDVRPEGLKPEEEVERRFGGDEGFLGWLASPLLCVDAEHLFLLDESGFVVDPPPVVDATPQDDFWQEVKP